MASLSPPQEYVNSFYLPMGFRDLKYSHREIKIKSILTYGKLKFQLPFQSARIIRPNGICIWVKGKY